MTTLTEQEKISDGATVGSHEHIIVAVLEEVLPKLRLANQMSPTTLANQQMVMAKLVLLHRNYAEGVHRSFLSDDMRKMLNILDTIIAAGTMPFNINYMPKVIDAPVDRLELKTIEVNFDTKVEGNKALSNGVSAMRSQANRPDAENETGVSAGQQWSDDLYRDQRIDGMQHGIHEAAIRDGNTYLLIDFDEKEGLRFTHEEAYDTNEGVMVFYDTKSSSTPAFAMKLWVLLGTEKTETVHVNVYWPDRIQKFVHGKGGLKALKGADWKDPKTGEPLGLPIVHYRNRGKPYGRSEIRDAVALQDAVNRINVSMIMAAELTAFQVRIARGFDPPAAIAPGSIIVIQKEGLTKDQVADMSVLEQGEVAPFLDGLRYLKGEIGETTSTPSPIFSDDLRRVSGEAMKQNDAPLVGKVRRLQVGLGDSWENSFRIAHKVQAAFSGTKPPTIESWRSRWRDAEFRQDQMILKAAVELEAIIGTEESLRMIAPIRNWKESDIQRILKQVEASREREMKLLQQSAASPEQTGANNGRRDTSGRRNGGPERKNAAGGTGVNRSRGKVPASGG